MRGREPVGGGSGTDSHLAFPTTTINVGHIDAAGPEVGTMALTERKQGKRGGHLLVELR